MSFEHYCRTCINATADLQIISADIFKFLEIDLRFNYLPRSHYAIRLPQKICADCYEKINKLREFYQQCRCAEEYLKTKFLETLEKLEAGESISSDEKEPDDVVTIEQEYASASASASSALGEDVDEEFVDEDFDPDAAIILAPDENANESDEFQNGIVVSLDILQENLDDMSQYESTDAAAPDISYSLEETMISKVAEDETETMDDAINISMTAANTQTSAKYFQCRFCDKSFSKYGERQTHEKYHTKPFKCEVCGKGFGQRSILRTHSALHYGKNVLCQLCGKRFARPSELILHNRMHRDEKPFECPIENCDKAFRLKQYLDAHMKRHSGVKDHKCQYCNAMFVNRPSLRGHVYNVHGNSYYQCDQCSKGFRRPLKIRRHLESVHKTQIVEVSHLKKYYGKSGEEPALS